MRGVTRFIHIFSLSSEPMLASEPAFLRCCCCCDCCYDCCCCCCCCYCTPTTTIGAPPASLLVRRAASPNQAGIGAAKTDRDSRRIHPFEHVPVMRRTELCLGVDVLLQRVPLHCPRAPPGCRGRKERQQADHRISQPRLLFLRIIPTLHY